MIKLAIATVEMHPQGDASKAEVIDTIYVWRISTLENKGARSTYNVSRQDPRVTGDLLAGDLQSGIVYNEFRHKYSDGLQVCLRKALEALT